MTISAQKARAIIAAEIKEAVRTSWDTSGYVEARHETADAIIAALAAAGLVIEEGWRPISEAPRDGTPVDLWIVGARDEVSFYAPIPTKQGKQWGGRGPICRWGHNPPNAPNWYPVDGLEAISGYPISPTVKVTHFRPLPPPPTGV